MKSHLDNDSCLPIYKKIPVICNTLRQTQCIGNYIFLHFVMVVITVLWTELWFVVVCCTLARSVRIEHKLLIRINVGYFKYIEQEREDILIALAAYSTVCHWSI